VKETLRLGKGSTFSIAETRPANFTETCTFLIPVPSLALKPRDSEFRLEEMPSFTVCRTALVGSANYIA
jgi:hypothetical protein